MMGTFDPSPIHQTFKFHTSDFYLTTIFLIFIFNVQRHKQFSVTSNEHCEGRSSKAATV